MHRHTHYAMGLSGGLFLRLLLDPLHQVGRLHPRLTLHRLHQLFFRLLRRQGGNLLQLFALNSKEFLQLGLSLLRGLLP